MTPPTLVPDRNAHQTRVIPNWALISLVVFTAIGLIVGGILFYNRQVQVIHQQKAGELKSIAALKVQQIAQWLQERLIDARMNSTDPFSDQAVAQWLSNPGDTTTQTALKARLQVIVAIVGYKNAFLTASDGSLVLSPDPGLTSLDAATRQLAAQAVANRQAMIGDLIRNPESGQVYLDIAAPIFDSKNVTAAVLVLQVDPEKFLYPLIQSWPVPSQSAETLLIRREGGDALYLNTLRFNSAPPLTLRIPLTRTDVPAVQAALGYTGEFEGVDYRGAAVLAEIMPVPGTDWYMVAKVDQAEIFSQVNSLGWVVVLIVTLAILMTIALAAYAFNLRQRLLYQHLFQAERDQRETQEEIRTTLYSIGDGVITTDRQGRVTRLNPVAERLTGWREKEAQGLPLDKVFPILNETTRAKVENPVERVLHEGVVVGLANHTLLVARDGQEHPIADSGAPIRDEKEGITGVVLVFRDQTEERAALRERALLTFTLTNSLNEIYILDAGTYHFRFVNDWAQKNLGYSQEGLRTMTVLDIKPEFTLESFKARVAPLAAGQIPTLVFETVHQRANGSRYPVEVHLQLFEYEGERVFLEVINDITERRQAEAALLESEARLVRAQAVAHVGNWELNLADHTMWASAEAFQIYGLERTSPYLPLEQVQRMVDAGDRPRMDAALQAVVRGEGRYDEEFRLRRANDGSPQVIHSIANLVADANGAPGRVAGVIQDITERKQAEARVAEQLDELRRWHSATLGREMRILELKEEVNEILNQAGLPPRYASPEETPAHV